MESERPLGESDGMCSRSSRGESGRLSESNPDDGTALQERLFFEKLLVADWGGRRDRPVAADEILLIAGEAFEPLFHQPPIGPIPEYLDPHSSVHGCVSEYEEKLEELDRYKAHELSRWLKERIGKKWCVAGKGYELQAERTDGAASQRFWFRPIEEPTDCGESTCVESAQHGT